jgi:hypothetical protein
MDILRATSRLRSGVPLACFLSGPADGRGGVSTLPSSATTLTVARPAPGGPGQQRLPSHSWLTWAGAGAAGDGMRAVMYLAGLRLRARWRGWLVLVVLVAVAGVRCWPRRRRCGPTVPMRVSWRPPKPLTCSSRAVRPALGSYFDTLARLPGAGAVAPFVGLNLEPLGYGALGPGGPITVAPFDGRSGQLLDVPKVLTGPLPT